MLRLALLLALSASVGAFSGSVLVMPGCVTKTCLNSVTRKHALRRPLVLRMQVDEATEKQNKIEQARKLADQAQAALREAELAEQKSNAMRGTKRRLDVRSELKARQSLAIVGDVLYKSWIKSFHDMSAFGLSDNEIMTEEARMSRVRKIFDEFDADSSAGIDKMELENALHGMGYEMGSDRITELFSEADTNKDNMISFEEFYKAISSLVLKQEIKILEAQVSAMENVASSSSSVVIPKTYADVIEALKGTELVGTSQLASKLLCELKEDGKVSKWDSCAPTFREYSVDKLKAVTKLQDPDQDMGLRPSGLIKKRIEITQATGIISLIALITSGLFPEPASTFVSRFGFAAFVINIFLPIFAVKIDEKIIDYEFSQQSDNVDRWARRHAGRFFASYLCGVPIEILDYSNTQRPFVKPYSRQNGNVDFEAIRQSNFTNAFQAVATYGLTPKQIQSQAVIHCAGLVAEVIKYGQATFGSDFLDDLQEQISLSQSFVDPFAKTFLARYGIISSYELIKNNESVFEKVVDGIKAGASCDSLIAIIESGEEPPL